MIVSRLLTLAPLVSAKHFITSLSFRSSAPIWAKSGESELAHESPAFAKLRRGRRETQRRSVPPVATVLFSSCEFVSIRGSTATCGRRLQIGSFGLKEQPAGCGFGDTTSWKLLLERAGVVELQY